MSAELVATLESPLPASLPVGAGTAVFCYGTCVHPGGALSGLRLLVDGTPHRPAAAGMPRPGAGRSGFWGTVPVPAQPRPGSVELAVAARTRGGAELTAPLGRIEVVPAEPPPRLAGPVPPGLIAVCMATYEPDPALLEAQLASLRAQTEDRWHCVISDDGSNPAAQARIEAVVAGDARFSIFPSERRRGFYGNFERALALAPREAPLIALCDQDDRWHPDKLATLRAALGSAQLVYSDQRLVAEDGRVLRPTLWKGRRNNHTSMASMLVANSVTGAAALFRREVADLALPFPMAPGLMLHDHWIALTALASGDLAYVDRPLYDYVQHRGAVFGDVTSGTGRRRASAARAAYFHGYLQRELLAKVLLVRCGGRLTPAKRRALERFVGAARSPAALAWLGARPLRALAGRTDTLGSETDFVRGVLWRWAAGARRSPDVSVPDVLSFEQRRLRRWRARV